MKVGDTVRVARGPLGGWLSHDQADYHFRYDDAYVKADQVGTVVEKYRWAKGSIGEKEERAGKAAPWWVVRFDHHYDWHSHERVDGALYVACAEGHVEIVQVPDEPADT